MPWARVWLAGIYESRLRKLTPRKTVLLSSLPLCFPLPPFLFMSPITKPNAVRVNRRSREMQGASSPPFRPRSYRLLSADLLRSLDWSAEEAANSHI